MAGGCGDSSKKGTCESDHDENQAGLDGQGQEKPAPIIGEHLEGGQF
jgi:hypothetical protein